MPSYYLQERAGQSQQQTWDFKQFIPDALFINLGTNDFAHGGGSWEADFTATYIAFVLTATERWGKPSMPVFLGQGNMNNGERLHDNLLAVGRAINASGGAAFYVDMRVGPTDGCNGHPGILGNAAMAAAAQPVIASVMGWT